MSSPRSPRRLLVAVLLGVLVGGGLMAVTPAGAEVTSAVATNWKKIWKKNLRPQADKRYYTKKKSDGTFVSKSDAAAKYAPAGSSYSKAESDARYPSKTQLIRGTILLSAQATGVSDFTSESISFGTTLSAAPTPHFIAPGDPLPAGCLGTAEAPDAVAGHLCVFETIRTNITGTPGIYQVAGGPGTNPFGALITAFSTGAGTAYVAGSWAVRPAAIAPNARRQAPRSGTLGVR